MSKSNQVSDTPSNGHKKALQNSSSLPVWERMFLRAKHGADYLDISKSHFHALVRDGALPQGRLISGAIRVWRRDELEQAANQMWEGC